MLALKKKDIKLRFIFNKIEKHRILSKFIVQYFQKKKEKNFLSKIKKMKFFRFFISKKSRVRMVNRCIFTNRSKGVSKQYGSSRFIIREYAQFGLLSGCHKAVW